jgi:hypothetical protein
MDRVIINNITFSEDNYDTLKNNIGTKLIYYLDVTLKVLEILMDSNFSQPTSENRIYWKPIESDDLNNSTIL